MKYFRDSLYPGYEESEWCFPGSICICFSCCSINFSSKPLWT